MPQNVVNAGITPEMMKGVESIFDGASAPTASQQEHLEALNASIVDEHKADNAIVSGGIANIAAARAMYRKTRPIVRDIKVGRNEPCPCGSGKKYKNCCLSTGKYETTHEI